jgi:hypothetical protein
METSVFIAGFCSDLWDCLATYEVTKEVSDLIPFLEYLPSQYPITTKGNRLFDIIETVQNAVSTGVLTSLNKQKIIHHLDRLSEDIVL